MIIAKVVIFTTNVLNRLFFNVYYIFFSTLKMFANSIQTVSWQHLPIDILNSQVFYLSVLDILYSPGVTFMCFLKAL